MSGFRSGSGTCATEIESAVYFAMLLPLILSTAITPKGSDEATKHRHISELFQVFKY
jgi:hypothetical protein